MPEWIVETVLLGLAERFKDQLPSVSLCKSILKHCHERLTHWQHTATRRDLINAAAAIQKGAIIGRSAQLRKAFSELNERWLQKTKHTIRIQHGPIADLKPKVLAEHLSFYAFNGDDFCIHCNGFQDWESPPKRGYTLQKDGVPRYTCGASSMSFVIPDQTKDKAIPIYQTAARWDTLRSCQIDCQRSRPQWSLASAPPLQILWTGDQSFPSLRCCFMQPHCRSPF